MAYDRPEKNSITENMKKCCCVCGIIWSEHPTGPESTCYRYRPKPEPAPVAWAASPTDVDVFVAKVRAAVRDGFFVVPNEATITVNGVPRVLARNPAANGEAKGE